VDAAVGAGRLLVLLPARRRHLRNRSLARER
jgi:hypothetical protein